MPEPVKVGRAGGEKTEHVFAEPESCSRARVADSSRHATSIISLIEAARLPELDIVSMTDSADYPRPRRHATWSLGEPSLVRQVLPAMPALHWVQATWAGVEPLLDPSLRRDYVLTNARGVFGALMSEYVFGYLLAHERRIFDKQRGAAGRAAGIRRRPGRCAASRSGCSASGRSARRWRGPRSISGCA